MGASDQTIATLANATQNAGQLELARQQAAAKGGPAPPSPMDVLSHTADGLNARSPGQALLQGTPAGAMVGIYHGMTSGSPTLAPGNVPTAMKQAFNDVVTQAGNIGTAQGALATFGAVMQTMTALEQMLSVPLSMIPFPAFPAVRVMDMDVGLPHAHNHPPNLIPPAPPVPLPSTGPIIPIPLLSGAMKTLINGMPAARCGDMGLGIFCGGFFPMYEVFLGSSSVWVEGCRAARVGVDITKHCIFSTPKPNDPPMGPMIGFTITSSANVLIGGIPMPSLTAMAMAAALKKAFQLLGKLGKSLTRAFQLKLPPGSRLRNALCAITGHPVDVASGRVFTTKTDFELPGRIPIEFRRTYDTSAIDYEGDLGPGWMHSYELHLWEDAETGRVVIRDEEVNQLSFAPLAVGERTFEPMSRSWLKRVERTEYEWSWPDGLVFHFAEPVGATAETVASSSSGTSSSTKRLRLTSIVDRNGNRIDLSYERGRLSTLRDSGGRRIDFRFESVGGGVATRLVEVRLALDARAERTARLAAFSYDSSGRLSIATDRGLSAWHYQYDDRTLVKETTGTGVSFHFEYKGRGATRRCVRTFGDGGIYDRRIEYDRTNRTTRVRDSLGAVTTFHLTAAGMPERIVDPNGATRMYGFTPEGWMLFELNAVGGLTKYSYDSRGNIIAVAQPDGAKYESEFDEAGRPVVHRDPAGLGERLEYDARGNLTAIVDVVGARTEFQYDRAGEIVATVDPTGAVWRSQWNGAGQPVESVDAGGGVTRFEYDEQGWLSRKVSSDGRETRYKHDAMGRVLQIWWADGGTHRYRYDADGNVVEFRNTEGHRVEWRYQGYHWPAERIDAVGARRRYVCDTEGRLVEVVNERGESYQMRRDPGGRVVRATSFDGREWGYEYDPSGRIAAVEAGADGEARVTRLTRDAAGRIVGRIRPDGSVLSFAYDQAGRLVAAKSPDNELKFSYDPRGRLIAEEQAGRVARYTYDAAGRRTSRESPWGARTEYAYDGAGRLANVRWPTDSVSMSHDTAGRMVARTLPGGLSESREYGVAGRLTRQTVRGRSDVVVGREYRYDAEGRLTELRSAGGRDDRYSYDPTERLSEATRADGGAETFSFDPAGNLSRRGTTGFTYERGNRIRQRGAEQIEHDAWGNVVAIVSPTGTSRYEYDIDQRLVAHIAPDGRRTEYQYDALGRRRAKAGPDGTTEFVWDRHVLMAEVAGNSHREYLFEPDSFRPLARFGEAGCEVYHVDHLGTPRELTDESGQVVWSARYDAYGRARVERAERDNPIRFPGQYEDVESGLHYNYHRYYDPDAGRYFTQDPLGLNAGTNFYRYVQNPINWDDPFGLFDEYEIARMGASGHSGDGKDAHELLQSAWLKENHPGYTGRSSGMGRDNPAIALTNAVHDDVSAAQRAAGLHDATTLSGQTARQNINANAKILEQQMILHGVPPNEARDIVNDMKKQARAFGRMYGIKGC